MSETTTIQVSRETRDKLLGLKPYPRATVEDVIIMLINTHEISMKITPQDPTNSAVDHKSPKAEPEAGTPNSSGRSQPASGSDVTPNDQEG